MNQVQITSLEQYEELLQGAINDNKIQNWKINTYTNEKQNFYVEKNYKIESILESKRDDLIFTIYKDFENEIGEASFTLTKADDLEKFKKELEDAIFICENAKSKKYELPKVTDDEVIDDHLSGMVFHNEKFFKDFCSGGLKLFFIEKLNIFKKIISEFNSSEVSIKLNYLEFLNNISKRSIMTSNDISKSYDKDSSYLEFVLTAIDKKSKKETEYIVYEDINDIYDFNFDEFFKKCISRAVDTSKENEPDNFKGIVVLSNEAAKDFFVPEPPTNSFINHASARLKFMKISKYEVDKEIISASKDKVTIYSNPLLENNRASSPYDGDGISARKVCLVDNNVFKNFFASKQYGTYLDVKPTGPIGTIEVLGGNKSSSEFFDSSSKFVEIISFAWFNPDVVTGNFSAEIRLGNIYDNGKKVPFKGGLFSGNVFEVLKDVELSKEVQNVPGFFGPKVLKFYNGEIIGV